jgi:FkbM family methyltransferase
MKTLIIPLLNSNTITVGIFINAGSRQETEAYGIAHFLEHMTFKGTNKRSSDDLMLELDSLGANYNAMTGHEFTAYYISGDPRDIEKFLDIIIDLYLIPTFPESDIVCIEPNDESYRILENNKFNVNAKKVHTINSCIGASDAQNIPIFENGNGSWSVSEFNYTQQVNPIGYTNKISLQTILSKFNDYDCFILKVDIEGSEKELFNNRSCWDLINKFEVVIIELHDWMLPGQNTAKPVFEWAVNNNRDILISGVNVFYFKN